MAARSATSSVQPRARPPTPSISATTAATRPASRSVTATTAPSSANRCTVARPIPEPAPVTSTTWPATDRLRLLNRAGGSASVGWSCFSSMARVSRGVVALTPPEPATMAVGETGQVARCLPDGPSDPMMDHDDLDLPR